MGQSEVTAKELVALFSKSLGEDKANEIIDHALKDLGLSGPEFSLQTGLIVLQKVAESSGLVGILARCATAKIMVKSR